MGGPSGRLHTPAVSWVRASSRRRGRGRGWGRGHENRVAHLLLALLGVSVQVEQRCFLVPTVLVLRQSCALDLNSVSTVMVQVEDEASVNTLGKAFCFRGPSASLSGSRRGRVFLSVSCSRFGIRVQSWCANTSDSWSGSKTEALTRSEY